MLQRKQNVGCTKYRNEGDDTDAETTNSKYYLSGFWAFILIILLIPIVKVEAGQSALYFQTYKYEKADQLVWNPWYSYSEWISSSNTYKTNGKTYTMYRYGTYF